MKLGLVTILPLLVSAGMAQEPARDPGQPPAEQQGAQRSAVDVQPGPPVIKNKDLWDQSGYFHPFTRMPRSTSQKRPGQEESSRAGGG